MARRITRPTGPIARAGTEDGLYELGTENRVHHAGRRVTALAVHGSTWWVILDWKEILYSRSGGAWKAAGSSEGLRALCLLPDRSGPWVGSAEAGLFRLRRGRLEAVESFRETEGREDWYTPWGGAPDTRWLAAGADGALYANVHVGGIARSRDRGRSWQPTINVDSDVHQVVVHPRRPKVVLAATAGGLAVSRDGGDSWTFVTRGLHATYQRALAIAGDTVLVSSSRSERGRESALYRWRLGAASLERCREGLPEWFSDNVNTGCLAAGPKLALLGAPDGSVYLSRDRGARWSRVREGLPPVRCVALAAS